MASLTASRMSASTMAMFSLPGDNLGATAGPHVLLRVTDTGGGIPSEQIKHIFRSHNEPAEGYLIRQVCMYGIAECILRLSQLTTDFKEIKELDINPLKVAEAGKGVRVVDARITLAAPAAGSPGA